MDNLKSWQVTTDIMKFAEKDSTASDLPADDFAATELMTAVPKLSFASTKQRSNDSKHELCILIGCAAAVLFGFACAGIVACVRRRKQAMKENSSVVTFESDAERSTISNFSSAADLDEKNCEPFTLAPPPYQ